MDFSISRRRFVATLSSTLAGLQLVKGRIFASAFGSDQASTLSNDENLGLWFSQPATQWADALPVGNGRLGAMVFGGTMSERIALNEDTLWSGFPRNWNNPGAKEHL